MRSVCTLLLVVAVVSIDRRPVVIISMDGFRYDYIDRLRLLTDERHTINHLDAFAVDGIRAPDGVQNVFATKTFPNHYSLATGLYEETHGVVTNYIYDQELNRSVSLSDFDTYTKQQLAYYYKGRTVL